MAELLRGRRWATFGIAAVLALLGPLSARAAEVSRDEFREAAEPICKINTEANERILAGVRAEVKHDQLKPAAASMAKAARALRETLVQLRALPEPAADRDRLAMWFELVKEEVAKFKLASAQLRAGKKAAASVTVVYLGSTANRANAQVIPFGFHYCLFEPSRFT